MDQRVNIRNVLLFAAHGNQPDGSAQNLLKQCRKHPIAERWWLTIAGDAQLQIEHALDLSRNDLAVFLVDGDASGPSMDFHAVASDPASPIASANGPVTPKEVLHTLAALRRRTELPRCFVLTVGAGRADAAEGTGPSTTRATQTSDGGATGAGATEPFEFLLSLLENPQPEFWETRLG